MFAYVPLLGFPDNNGLTMIIKSGKSNKSCSEPVSDLFTGDMSIKQSFTRIYD